MTAALEVRGLCKRFGALRVTDQVNLVLAPGEMHALIGPNGAGKTSLIGQVTGVLRPDTGQVFLQGREVTDLPAWRRARAGLARSFQISALAGAFSVRENAALAVQGMDQDRLRPVGVAVRHAGWNAAADAALAIVGLTARASVRARDLSHGEQRSLELACALAMRPAVLVLDEPLAGMGPEESARIVTLLRSLKGRYGVLLVEHDMDAVFALADRVSVLVAGGVIASGPPAAIRADPAVRAAYLGDG
jgi:branched-chain amino acid transport system ATP-binding protein